MKTALSILALVLLTGCPPDRRLDEEDPPDVVRHELQVTYHATTSLNNATADRILADATQILQVDHGEDDVACAVRLARQGNVTEFDAGDGSIDSRAEFEAMMQLPGDIKLVDEINWCGRLIPNVAGCARPGGSVVVTPTLLYRGLLWAHEYGHTKGLRHRDNGEAVMYIALGLSRRKLNRAECEAFRR